MDAGKKEEWNANNDHGTSNYGVYKFPENEPMSSYQFSVGEVASRSRTLGLSEIFNNNTAPSGPVNYAYFVSGPETARADNENVHTLSSLFHFDGHRSRTQNLSFTVSPSGDIKSVGIGGFNLEAKTLLDIILPGDLKGGFGFNSKGYNLLKADPETGALEIPRSPNSGTHVNFLVPPETNSTYLQNLIPQGKIVSIEEFKDEYQEGGLIKTLRADVVSNLNIPEADALVLEGYPVRVSVELDTNDPARHPTLIIGELMREHLEGYMRQDPAEAQQVIDNLPAGLLEQFGLEITPDGITNNFIADNNLGHSPQPSPATQPAGITSEIQPMVTTRDFQP